MFFQTVLAMHIHFSRCSCCWCCCCRPFCSLSILPIFSLLVGDCKTAYSFDIFVVVYCSLSYNREIHSNRWLFARFILYRCVAIRLGLCLFTIIIGFKCYWLQELCACVPYCAVLCVDAIYCIAVIATRLTFKVMHCFALMFSWHENPFIAIWYPPTTSIGKR